MKLLITTLLVFLFYSNITANIIPPKQIDNNLINCATQILKSNHNMNQLIAYASEININQFLEQLKQSITILKINTIEPTIIKTTKNMIWFYNIYTIIINKINQYQIFLKSLIKSKILNRRQRFIILYLGTEDIHDITDISWKEYITNMIIIHFSANENVISTYFPYKNGSCGNNQVDKLGKCIEIRNIEQWFPNKIPHNLNNCTIKVSQNIYAPSSINPNVTTDNPVKAGFETLLIKNIVQKLNLFSKICATTFLGFGFKYLNGSYAEPHKYLQQNSCDIAYGFLPINESFFQDFDYGYVEYNSRFVWSVPTASPGPQWKSIFLIFAQLLWLTILAMLILNIFVWWMFGKSEHETFDFGSCVLKAWYSLLLGSIEQPKTTKMRILVLVWVIYSFLIATAYQSQLLSILLTPVYDHQITTVEDILKSDLHIVYLDIHSAIFRNSTNKYEQEIYRRATSLTFDNFVKMRNSYDRKTAFPGTEISTRYLITKNYTYPNGRPMIYMFHDAVKTGGCAIATRKGYPLLERFNFLIIRFLENGIFYKWMADINIIAKISGQDANYSLTMNHLRGAFLLWLFGITLASLSLCFELCIYKIHN